jgi:hypothetical protein
MGKQGKEGYVMKTLMRLIFVFMLVFVAGPAFGAEVMQVFNCEMDDEATEEDATAMSQEWLNAAKKMPGGENFKTFVSFPVAVTNPGEHDILVVVVAPSFNEWDKFWDNYLGSPVEAVDQKYREKIQCPGSALWEVQRAK